MDSGDPSILLSRLDFYRLQCNRRTFLALWELLDRWGRSYKLFPWKGFDDSSVNRKSPKTEYQRTFIGKVGLDHEKYQVSILDPFLPSYPPFRRGSSQVGRIDGTRVPEPKTDQGPL